MGVLYSFSTPLKLIPKFVLTKLLGDHQGVNNLNMLSCKERKEVIKNKA